MAEQNQMLTRHFSPPQPLSSKKNLANQATVMVLLSKLAVHYYRPDFTENQAKSLIEDMLEDLSSFSVHEIESAIRSYRQNPENKFFPRSADLRGIVLSWRDKPARLPTFKEPVMHGKPATKSVGDVLRDHGFCAAADGWELWKSRRTQAKP